MGARLERRILRPAAPTGMRCEARHCKEAATHIYQEVWSRRPGGETWIGLASYLCSKHALERQEFYGPAVEMEA